MERVIQIYRFDFQTPLVSLSPICLILLLEEVGNALCGEITLATLCIIPTSGYISGKAHVSLQLKGKLGLQPFSWG